MTHIKQVEDGSGGVHWVNEYGHAVGIMIGTRNYYLEPTESTNRLMLWNPIDTKEFTYNPTKHHRLRFHGSTITGLAEYLPKVGMPSLGPEGYDITDITELSVHAEWYSLFYVDVEHHQTLVTGKTIKHTTRVSMVDYYADESFKTEQASAE